MQLAPTPRDTVLKDGTAHLYRFRRAFQRASSINGGLPLLVVPSMINRWYVVDLRNGASLVSALVGAGIDTFCLDWGRAEDEDRYFTWDDVIARIHRAIRRVKRMTGAPKVGVLGYCMGATVAGIAAALRPDDVAAFINLAGPFDFSRAGLLRDLVAAQHFDVDAITEAGNLPALQMQSGFVALRPTAQIAKWIGLVDRGDEESFRDSFAALETWANDNIPFPAAAYRTYIRELYQENRLYQGEHFVGGERVDLAKIACPVMTVTAEKDAICPPDAARGLHDQCTSNDKELVVVPGGHVGAVVGSRAPKVLYPAMATWLQKRLGIQGVN